MEKKGLMQKKHIKRIAAAIALMIVSICALCIDMNHLLNYTNVAAAVEFIKIDIDFLIFGRVIPICL